MALSVVGTPTTASSQSSVLTLAVNTPAGLQDGDMLVAALRNQNAATADFSAPGWVRSSAAFIASSAAGRSTGFFTRIVTSAGSEPASHTFTAGASGRWAVVMFIVRSSNGAGIEVGEMSSPYEGIGITNGRRAPGFTTANAPGLLLGMFASEFSSGNDHVPSAYPAGFTAVAPLVVTTTALTSSRTTVWAGWQAVAATPTSNCDVLYAGTSASAPTVQSVMLYEGFVADTSTESVFIELGEPGGPVEHEVFIWDGLEEQTVDQILSLPENQSYTVADMLADIAADRDVYWAHRGGSANWPEMTMRAYTNAAWWGVKALEISMWRTTDGVWIMNHDQTLDRTVASEHDGLGNINTGVSTTFLGVPVNVPTSGGVIGRAEDILSTYGQKLLMVLDNKPGADYVNWLEWIKTQVPDATNRVIIKIDGASGVTRYQQAKAAGFYVAAYFYDDTPTATIDEKMPYVDFPGMNNSAPQTAWDYLAAFGKPIWGHVLQSFAAYTEAKTKGASIFQCANVKAIVPVVNNVI